MTRRRALSFAELAALSLAAYAVATGVPRLLTPVYGTLYVRELHAPVAAASVVVGAAAPVGRAARALLVVVATLLVGVQLLFNSWLLPFFVKEDPRLGTAAGLVFGVYAHVALVAAVVQQSQGRVSAAAWALILSAALNWSGGGNVHAAAFQASWRIFGSAGTVLLAQLVYLAVAWAWFSRGEKSTSSAPVFNALALAVAACAAYCALAIPQYQFLRRMDATPRNLPDDTNPRYTVVARVESVTGFLSVVDDMTSEHVPRLLRCGHSVLGGVFLNYNSDSIYGIFYVMEFVRFVKREREHVPRSLQIGLGIGSSTKALHEHLAGAVEMDIVELDPLVTELARSHFGYPDAPSIKHYAVDGFAFLEQRAGEAKKYDYVLHDLFTGGFVPGHLYTRETMRLIGAALRDDGILVLNIVAGVESATLWSVYKTVGEVFPHIEAYAELPNEGTEYTPQSLRNIVLYASRWPIVFELPRDIDEYDGVYRMMLAAFPQMRIAVTVPANTTEITAADHSRLDDYQLPAAEQHYHVMRDVFGLEMWAFF